MGMGNKCAIKSTLNNNTKQRRKIMKLTMCFLVPLFMLGCSGINGFVKSSDSLTHKSIDINGGEVRGFSFENRLLPARISCSKETPMHVASKQ